MKNANNKNCLLKRFVEDEVIAEFRGHEPTNISVSRMRVNNPNASIRIENQEISGIEQSLPNLFRCLGIIHGDT